MTFEKPIKFSQHALDNITDRGTSYVFFIGGVK